MSKISDSDHHKAREAKPHPTAVKNEEFQKHYTPETQAALADGETQSEAPKPVVKPSKTKIAKKVRREKKANTGT